MLMLTGRGGCEEGDGGSGVLERDDERDESEGADGAGDGVVSLDGTIGTPLTVDLMDASVTGASVVDAASTLLLDDGDDTTRVGRTLEAPEEDGEAEEVEAEEDDEEADGRHCGQSTPSQQCAPVEGGLLLRTGLR